MGVKHVLCNANRNILPFSGLSYATFIIQSRYKKIINYNAETLTFVELFDSAQFQVFLCFII